MGASEGLDDEVSREIVSHGSNKNCFPYLMNAYAGCRRFGLDAAARREPGSRCSSGHRLQAKRASRARFLLETCGRGRGLLEITRPVLDWLAKVGVDTVC
jgi:hypothetical protein